MSGSARVRISAAAHALGRLRADNCRLAESLGLERDWLTGRTGILTRRVCAPDENCLSLAATALQRLLRRAGLPSSAIGAETAIIYIHNSIEQGTPPAAIRLAAGLGLRHPRCISMEGVCAEAVQGLGLAASLLRSGDCSRAIVLAAANYPPLINPADPGTAGLFGSGAGGALLELSADNSRPALLASDWVTDTQLADLGELTLDHFAQDGPALTAYASAYRMDGERLAREVLGAVPPYFAAFLARLGWDKEALGAVIAHQPNVKLLRLLGRRLRLREEQLPEFCSRCGNLGPASLLFGLSRYLRKNAASRAPFVLLGFGLGFCQGCAAFEFTD
ncbi:hypothetical protein IT575_14340 [bacterium]|nr:hypothetical protein [bacterium]